MLSSKERAELRAQSTTLDTTLMVGKGGVTETVIAEAENQLTARELVKGKVLEGALMTPREVSDAICEATGAGYLPGGHQGGLQHLSLHQFPGSEQILRLRENRFRDAAFSHNQGRFQVVGLCPKFRSLFTCQHSLPP